MSNVIPFRPRARPPAPSAAIVHKVVNGEIIECVDLDALTPAERARCFARGSFGASPRDGDDAPDA
jgi:hypothetical protein